MQRDGVRITCVDGQMCGQLCSFVSEILVAIGSFGIFTTQWMRVNCSDISGMDDPRNVYMSST
jgi:hypothetical protein